MRNIFDELGGLHGRLRDLLGFDRQSVFITDFKRDPQRSVNKARRTGRAVVVTSRGVPTLTLLPGDGSELMALQAELWRHACNNDPGLQQRAFATHPILKDIVGEATKLKRSADAAGFDAGDPGTWSNEPETAILIPFAEILRDREGDE
ncbi:MAG: hypothetical protein AAGI30_11570 [Planctomycetota bacterium]